MTNAADAAIAYRQRGWYPVRIPPGCKGPTEPGWQHKLHDEADIPKVFAGSWNVGLLLGPSGLVDIDLDCDEAAALAGSYLPKTDAVTGRTGHPRRHYWYRCPEITATRRFKAPRGQKILEVRAGAGIQTVVGPSTHPEGGVYDLLLGEPAEVSADELISAVECLRDQVLAMWGQTVEPEKPKVYRPSALRRATDDHCEHCVERATAYVAAMPPAVAGQHGHDALFAAACALVNGFSLEAETAEAILLAEFNPRCLPPWSERDVHRKVDQALVTSHREPPGYLLTRGTDDSILGDDFDLDAWGSPKAPVVPVDATGSITATSTGSTVITQSGGQSSALPEALFDVPGLVGDVVRLNLSTCWRVQKELALAAAIALQAVLAGPRIRDLRQGRTNMYILCIAPTATGKDHGRVVNRTLLEAAGMSQYEGASRIGSEVGLIRHLESLGGNALLQIDEFGKVLRAMNNPRSSPYLAAIPGTLLELYSASSSSYRGTANADVALTKVMEHPTLTILGSTVAESLYKGLRRESVTDGFVPRLLMFEGLDEPAEGPKRPIEPSPDLVHCVRLWSMSHATDSDWGGVKALRDGPGVVDQWAALAEQVRERCRGADEITRAVWSRTEQHASKLAMVYAASKDGATVKEIGRDAAEWASAVACHLSSRMRTRVVERVAETEYGHQCNELMEWLRKQPNRSATMTEYARAYRGMRSDERRELVKGLAETGLIALDTGKRGGGVVFRLVEGGAA